MSNRKPLVIGSGGQFQQLQAADALVDGSGAAFLTTASALALTSGHLFVGNGSNVATDVALSGDATLANTGAITVTKTGGVAFGSFATGTDAANLTGTLGSARLSGSYTGVTGVGTLTAGTWNATTIAVNRGGTGQTAYTDGQLLIGNTGTGGLSKTTLTAGANITITNGSGTITIAASAPGTGTVTNVSSASADLTVATGTTTPVLTVVSAPKWTTGRTVGITGDFSYTSGSLDGSGNVTGTGTLATVNANVGTFGDATHVGAFTVNAKGLITAASSVAISAGGSGTVTSVDMTLPSFLAVSGNPVTTAGTLAVTLATQSANLVFAGPTSGGAATPTFRSLVVADLPTVTVAKGGTGAATLTNHGVLLGQGTGAVVAAAAMTNQQVLVGVTGADPAPQTIGMVLISEATPSGTGVVTFSSLGSYRSLRVTGMGRGTASATSVIVTMTFNSDAGANYDYQRAYGTGTGANALNANGVAQAGIYLADMTANTATADVASAFEMDIFDYAGTTFQKTVIGNYNLKVGTTNTGQYIFMVGGFWRSTAAITRIDLTLSSGNWVAGSRVSLYGIN